jgi:Arc/MetJ-type ribon-helix-helix transcriptional regulator
VSLQLTQDQEDRIQAVVRTGAYSSPEEALDAALTTVEAVAADEFEGEPAELESLLAEGLASRELSEAEFWNSVDRETEILLQSAAKGRRT